MIPHPIVSELNNSILWTAIDQSKHTIVITDEAGNIVYVNPYFCDISGYSYDEAVGQNPRILKSGEQEDYVYQDLWSTISTGEVWSGKMCNRNKSGSLYWEDMTVYPINYDEETFYVAIKKDITAQVLAEQQLEQTQYILQSTINAVTETLIMVNRDEEILAANITSAKRFGLPLEEIYSISGKEMMGSELYEHRRSLLHQVLEQGKPLVDRDVRDSRYFETLYYPVKDGDHVDNVVIFSRDITQEVKINQELKESEELTRAILTSISDAVFITNDDGQFTYVCPNAHSTFGYTQDEMLRMGNITELLHDLHIDGDQLTNTGELLNLEATTTDKSGQTHDLLINIKTVEINGGSRLFTCRDVTEYKRIEDDLRHHSTILNNVVDAIVVTDLEFNVYSLNSAAEAIYEQTNEDAIGKNLEELSRSSYLKITREEAVGTLFERGYWSGEIIHQLNNGKTLHTISTFNIVHDSHDVPIGIVGIKRDITERIKAEKALKASERRFRQALENAPVPIMLHSEDGEVLMINHVWTEATGYTHEDIPTIEAWTTKAYGKSKHAIQKIIEELHETNSRTNEGVFEIKTTDERTLLWNFHSTPLDQLADGRKVSMSIAIDITEQVQLQEQATQAQVLEAELNKERELSVLKERLMSIISHEFRTPLTVIQTSSDLLETYFDRLDEEKRQKHLQRISQQVKKATTLLDQTMQLRYATSGKIEFAPASIDIEMFTQTVFDKMKFADNDAHIMRYNCDLHTESIQADVTLMEHILENLLSNAIKYTQHGKSIDLQIAQEGEYTQFTVTDEGIGIPPEDMKRLFEPYHRASNVGSRQGTGLGLAIVKEYVQLHNGHISCHSDEGKGSRFTVTVPIQQL